MFSDRGGQDWGSPVEWEVDLGEALGEISGQGLGSEDREQGEGYREPNNSRIVGWRGAGDPEGG